MKRKSQNRSARLQASKRKTLSGELEAQEGSHEPQRGELGAQG
jgi:hypothetical protein